MEVQLDEIDRRVIHALMDDARNTSAPEIANAVDVSPGTIRNRIDRLEEAGIIRGYHAHVDFEEATGALTNLYTCNAPVSDRETLAGQVRAIPGVINVRELMTGRRNLHVLAIGENTADLRRIARAISSLGIEIEDENLVQNESFHPYAPYGPADEPRETVSDFVSLAGGSEIAEVTVASDAPVVGLTLETAVDEELVDEEALIIAIEREDAVITPHGDTEINSGDFVTIFSRGGVDDETVFAFSDGVLEH